MIKLLHSYIVNVLGYILMVGLFSAVILALFDAV